MARLRSPRFFSAFIFGGAAALATSSLVAAGCSSSSDTPAGSNDASNGSDVASDHVADDSATSDGATVDAPEDHTPGLPPHVAFITAESFDGDLVSYANGLIPADAGAITDGTTAANTICTYVANAAGVKGTFVALGVGDAQGEFTDADGAWSRIDGMPLADNAADLTQGRWHSSLNVTEVGGTVVDSTTVIPWVLGYTGEDCNGWTSAATNVTGQTGYATRIGYGVFYDTPFFCNYKLPLYCAQVGSGGGPNVYPAIASGAKLAFLTDDTYPLDLAADPAAVLDASAGSGDQAHVVADAICNEVAAGHGKPGTFRAWISSETASAASYFTSQSMTGPWIRPDGYPIASSLADLIGNGPANPVSVGAGGDVASSLDSLVITGSVANGAKGLTCASFTTNLGTASADMGSALVRGPAWTNTMDQEACNGAPGGIFCFEK